MFVILTKLIFVRKEGGEKVLKHLAVYSSSLHID